MIQYTGTTLNIKTISYKTLSTTLKELEVDNLNNDTMEINIKKRHIVIFVAFISAILLIVSNCQTIKKITHAKDISELNGIYNDGEYVKVSFDKILYMEYDGVYGGTQKRYAVCSTPDSDIFYVNGTRDKYILVEISNTKEIESIESSSNKHYQIIGIIEKNVYVTKEFLEKRNSDEKTENDIIITEIKHQDIYSTRIINGCFIILFCIILFYHWGGTHIIVRKKHK